MHDLVRKLRTVFSDVFIALDEFIVKLRNLGLNIDEVRQILEKRLITVAVGKDKVLHFVYLGDEEDLENVVTTVFKTGATKVHEVTLADFVKKIVQDPRIVNVDERSRFIDEILIRSKAYNWFVKECRLSVYQSSPNVYKFRATLGKDGKEVLLKSCIVDKKSRHGAIVVSAVRVSPWLYIFSKMKNVVEGKEVKIVVQGTTINATIDRMRGKINFIPTKAYFVSDGLTSLLMLM